MDELKILADKVRSRLGESVLVTDRFVFPKLELDLDLQRGFEGHENATLIQRADLFDVKYSGFFVEAFKTFLNEKYTPRICDSAVLSDFKDKAARMKDNKRVEVYDGLRQDFYSQLVNFTEAERSYEEAEKVVLFFADVFNEKARWL